MEALAKLQISQTEKQEKAEARQERAEVNQAQTNLLLQQLSTELVDSQTKQRQHELVIQKLLTKLVDSHIVEHTYEGSDNPSEVSKFFRSLQRFSKTEGWNPEEVASRSKEYFTGAAQDWYEA